MPTLLSDGDGLHLMAHSGLPVDNFGYSTEEVGSARWIKQSSRGTAVVLVPSYFGWLRVLHDADTVLSPRPDGRSWRVDVVCEPIGWLGTYRRSRVTGRWFTGRHRDHLLGWPTDDL